MAQKFDYSLIMDKFYVVTIDGNRTGYAVSKTDAKKIVAWLESAADGDDVEIVRKSNDRP